VSWLRRAILIGFLAIVVAGATWLWLGRRPHVAPAIDAAALTNWPVVVSDGTDPWVVSVVPPARLMSMLAADATRHAGRALITPPHSGLPLVLRTEFEEGLQGVFGTDSVMRMAHDAGLDAARFEPVCLAHHVRSDADGRAEVYFVPFDSAPFSQLRVDLIPAFPEQAGTGMYDPSTLSPILIVGATDTAFERWWPLRFNPDQDCVASVTVSASGQN